MSLNRLYILVNIVGFFYFKIWAFHLISNEGIFFSHNYLNKTIFNWLVQSIFGWTEKVEHIIVNKQLMTRYLFHIYNAWNVSYNAEKFGIGD